MAEAGRAPPAEVDLLIVGGGITGAGILEEAVRAGLRALLVDRGDFAGGTSSASSKLVHGGLRYLAAGQLRLTWQSVRERARLLRERPGLVETQVFLMPLYAGQRPGRTALRAGLALYDAMAGHARTRWLDAAGALEAEPRIAPENLLGAMRYEDARTDDARLVLRTILDAEGRGGHVRNYMEVTGLRRGAARIAGAELLDRLSGEPHRVRARAVIEACGPESGLLAPNTRAPRLRPLRGSHLVFASARLPLRHAVSWLHPRDQRPVFVYPWEGMTLLGTTDVDQDAGGGRPRISAQERDYLLEACAAQFPSAGLGAGDIVATYAGVRPVVAGGKGAPSAESRESALFAQPGHVLVTGGKLTTFRLTARQALAAAGFPPAKPRAPAAPQFARVPARYGAGFEQWLRALPIAYRELLPSSLYAWSELRWACEREHVQRLDDLLLRRVRVGLTLPDGGASLLPRVRELCGDALGWDDARWRREETGYRALWRSEHAPP